MQLFFTHPFTRFENVYKHPQIQKQSKFNQNFLIVFSKLLIIILISKVALCAFFGFSAVLPVFQGFFLPFRSFCTFDFLKRKNALISRKFACGCLPAYGFDCRRDSDSPCNCTLSGHTYRYPAYRPHQCRLPRLPYTRFTILPLSKNSSIEMQLNCCITFRSRSLWDVTFKTMLSTSK